MNERQIRCFLEVCKDVNFTKAAERLMLPQPAISRYISSLENELGVSLFARENSRNVNLTSEGKDFYNIFLRFITEYDDKLDQLHTDLKPLRIGYNVGWSSSAFLPSVLEKCRQRSSQFKATVDCLDFGHLTRALYERKLDAIITLEDTCTSMPEIALDRVAQIERNITYLRSKYPDLTDPSDLRNEIFYVVDNNNIMKISNAIERFCAPYNFIPKLEFVSNMDTVLARIENGLGVAFLDEWALGAANSDLAHITLPSRHNICLAWTNGSYPVELRIFHEELKEQLLDIR